MQAQDTVGPPATLEEPWWFNWSQPPPHQLRDLCSEDQVPDVGGDIGGGMSKNRFRAITFDWSVLRT